MSADFVAWSLILEMNCPNLAFDKLFYKISNMMLAPMASIAIRDDKGRNKIYRRGFFSLR